MVAYLGKLVCEEVERSADGVKARLALRIFEWDESEESVLELTGSSWTYHTWL